MLYTGWQCYRLMTDTEKVKWKNAVIHRDEVSDKDGYMTFLLDHRQYHTFLEFLQAGFNWKETKEGVEYWHNIANKYKIHDVLSPIKQYKKPPPKTF